MQRAFSLVELSIVLVILGLLVGGVLSGQSLIRAAELRAVVTEYQRYLAATQAFRDKYFAIPGDMTNATAFWGKDTTNCSGNTGTAMTPGTCNGDGSGTLNDPAGASATGEIFQFWKQLALAGIIEGSYPGIAGSNSAFDNTIGNVPKSKMNNAVWGTRNVGVYSGDGSTYAYDYGNFFGFSSFGGTGAILKPEEAWNIDTKLDDGKPGSGKIIAVFWNNACATATSKTDYTSPYNLSNSALACALYFAKAF